MVSFRSALSLSLLLARNTGAAPINTERYRELTDGSGNTGACRGNGGGADRVDSRDKVVDNQGECENTCDGDDGCIAYAFNDSSGDCLIYGPGQDGMCSLVQAGQADTKQRYHNYQSCGDCAINGVAAPDKLVENLCGSCSKAMPSSLSPSQSICSTVDGVWTPGKWTAGQWQAPQGGWTGSSFTHDTQLGSTNVHTISVAVNFHCYDRVHNDGQPQCTGSSSCQTDFEDLRLAEHCPEGCVYYPRNGNHAPYCDGVPSDGESACIESFESDAVWQESACTGLTGCTYVPAPTWAAPPLTIHAPPVDLGPGWMSDPLNATESSGDCTGVNIAQCDGQDHIAGFAYGVCRADAPATPNGAHLNQKWCKNCINTDGDQVNLNERTCAQTCLDDPSGTCVAFSQADGGNCIIYGIDVDQYLYNPGDPEHQWGGWSHKHEPCIGKNFPVGCEPINTIKPNQKFLCRHLVMDSTRWLAWGGADEGSSSADKVTVELVVQPALVGGDITTTVTADDFTDDMKTALREKMATVAFVDAAKDVTVEVTDHDELAHTATVLFTISAPSNAAVIPMTGLLDTVLVSKTRDGSFYFYSKKTGGNSNKNEGVMVPVHSKIAGIVVSGQRHNLVDKSKESYTRGWSETHDFGKVCPEETMDESSNEDGDGENPSSPASFYKRHDITVMSAAAAAAAAFFTLN